MPERINEELLDKGDDIEKLIAEIYRNATVAKQFSDSPFVKVLLMKIQDRAYELHTKLDKDK